MQDGAPSATAARPRTGIERAALAAVARGETTLAAVYDVRPEDLATLRGLAAQLASAGRDDLARTLLEGAVALDDHDRWTLRALATVHLRQGDARQALDAATRAHGLAVATHHADGEAALLAARALVALGRLDDARGWLAHARADRTAAATVRTGARSLSRRIA